MTFNSTTMIRLIDLIKLSGVHLGNFKIHCATGINPTPLEAFFDGKFKEWQEYQNKRNFECDEILSLIDLKNSKWLFAGIFRVNGVVEKTKSGKTWYEYSTTEVKGLENLSGRAIIDFQKNFRASYLIGKKYYDKLILSELRDQRMSVGDFPGYNSVLISYHILRTLVRESLPSWESALSNVAGIYIVTDVKTGRQYIGSAHGGEGIWQRWLAYAKSGHGGNKELRAILKKEGIEYAKNFQFAILEVCDLNTHKDYVISRESHWKNVLKTREFGYNSN